MVTEVLDRQLYTTISTSKLASFAEAMPEHRLRAHIMALKHKQTARINTPKSGSGLPSCSLLSCSLALSHPPILGMSATCGVQRAACGVWHAACDVEWWGGQEE